MLDPKHMGQRSLQSKTAAAGMGDAGNCAFPKDLAFLRTSDFLGVPRASHLRDVPLRDPEE